MSLLLTAIIRFGDIISTALLVRALMSWIVPISGAGLVRNIYDVLVRLTEPIVSPCRSFLNKYFNTGMVDFSVFVAMILVELVTRVLVRVLILLV